MDMLSGKKNIVYPVRRKKKSPSQDKSKAACKTVVYFSENYGNTSLILLHQMASKHYLQTLILFNVFHPEKKIPSVIANRTP